MANSCKQTFSQEVQSTRPSITSGSASPKAALGDASVPGAGLRVVPFHLSQANMPFLSIYLLTLEQDTEHATSVLQAASTLQQQTFLQVRGPGSGLAQALSQSLGL